jgi:electron transport complex protein RnfB
VQVDTAELGAREDSNVTAAAREASYRRLAEHLDSLPNGFPSTDGGVELRILARLFQPDEAELAAGLKLRMETTQEIAARLGGEPKALARMLKNLARRGLIAFGRGEDGLTYGALPFVVGIYEYQVGSLDSEFAQLFEDYYQMSFHKALAMQPPVHRVIPVRETVRTDIEINPYEDAAAIIGGAASWGVLDCICRKQKALIGEPCDHPLDVCMAFSSRSDAFEGNPVIRAQTQEEALKTLRRAADAGLVHSVSNAKEGVGYICNCCTCSCGVLRGLAELGVANVVARSSFVNQVEESICSGCELCVEHCQFDALSVHGILMIDSARCVGCGVCVPTCPDGALALVLRPAEDILPVPETEDAWRAARAQARGIDLAPLL